MVFAFMFIVVLIAVQVMVSLATTFNRRVVRKLGEANQPSQQILDFEARVLAERIVHLSTLSVAPTSVTSKKLEVRPIKHIVQEPVNA